MIIFILITVSSHHDYRCQQVIITYSVVGLWILVENTSFKDSQSPRSGEELIPNSNKHNLAAVYIRNTHFSIDYMLLYTYIYILIITWYKFIYYIHIDCLIPVPGETFMIAKHRAIVLTQKLQRWVMAWQLSAPDVRQRRWKEIRKIHGHPQPNTEQSWKLLTLGEFSETYHPLVRSSV
jgi:hypothetical protein